MEAKIREQLEENAEMHYQDMRPSEIVPCLPDEHLIKVAMGSIEGYLEDAVAELTHETGDKLYATKAINRALELLRAVQRA